MPDPLLNRRLGRYQIHQEIGRGGMARVYRATDTLLQRQVALKILAPQFSDDPDFARRFEREAITAANLRHPAIITIFDVGEADGLHYIAMEYVAGRTLNEALAERGKLGLPLTVGVLQPVAEALQYAHSQGAVHRDVKPHNILIDTDGRVLLTDFGIAIGPKAGSERLTQAGMFMGTPDYLSPEQAQSQPPGGRSDLYSLAIVAWEALTGKVPFTGAPPQLIMAHVYTPAPAIRSVGPNLPPELDGIFARALAKAPDARFAKATDFTEALRTVAQRYGMSAASREEIAALAVPAGSSAGQATIAMQAAPGSAQGQVGADARAQGFPIGEIFGPPPAGTQAPIAEIFGAPATAAGPARPNPVQGAAQQPNRTLPQPAAQTRRQTPPEMVYPRSQADDAYIPPPPPPRRSSYSEDRSGGPPWAAIVMGAVILLLIGLLMFQSTRHGAGTAGKSGSGSLQAVFGPTSVTETPPVPTATTAAPPTPVPTDRPQAAAAAATTAPAATATTAATAVPASPTPPPTATSPSATIAASTPSPTAAPPTAPPTQPPTATPQPTPSPSATTPATVTAVAEVSTASPPAGPTPQGGGADLVFQSGAALNLFDVGAGSAKPVSATAQSVGPAAISPDGATILFDALQDNSRRIFRFIKASGEAAVLIHDNGDDYDPAWSADGSQILYTSTQDGNPEIYRADATGKQAERVTNDPGEDDYASFTPDGKQLVWEGRRNNHWQILIMSQDEMQRLVEPVKGHDDRDPRVSPDGTHVVFASNRDRPDGGFDLYIQELPGGSPQRLTTSPTGSARGPEWSPDGTTIVFFSNMRGNNDLYLIPASGGAPHVLTTTDVDERWPVWGR